MAFHSFPKRTPTNPSSSNGGFTQLTLQPENPVPRADNTATTSKHNHPTPTDVGKAIQGKCHALEKTHTTRQLLKNNLTKLVGLRDRKVVPKAFQVNIKLTFPGTNPDREQIKTWWAAEKEAGLSLLTTAIRINRELIERMEANYKKINADLTSTMGDSTMSNMDTQLWSLFVQRTREGLEATTQNNVEGREKRKTPTTTPKDSPKPHAPKKGGKGKGKKGKK